VRIVNAPGKVSQTTGTQHNITANVFNGSNSFTANTVITSLAPGVITTVAFPSYNPTVLGISNIVVNVANDQNNVNNTVAFTQSVTCNVMGTGPASFAPKSYSVGVGFYTGSGIIYKRFSTAASQTLLGVDLAVSSAAANIGNSVYAAVANSIGVVQATSNALVITSAELNTIQSFVFNRPSKTL